MIQDNQDLRQTGRTTKALVEMHRDDIYIVCNKVMVEYCKRIRSDVTIRPITDYIKNRESGTSDRFVFDHAWNRNYLTQYERLDIRRSLRGRRKEF